MNHIKYKDDKHHYKQRCAERGIDPKDSDNIVLNPVIVSAQPDRSTFKYTDWPTGYDNPVTVYVSASGRALIPESVHKRRSARKFFE